MTSTRKLIGYYAAFTGLGLVGASLGQTLGDLARQTGSLLSEVSVLFAGRSLGYMLGALLGGRVYDRTSGHPVLFVVLASLAMLLGVTPVVSNLPTLVAVTAGAGLALGMLDVGCNSLLVWEFDKKSPPFLNGLHFTYGIGAFLSPIIIARATVWGGDFAWGYWALAVWVLAPGVWLATLASPTPIHPEERTGDRPVPRMFVALVVLFFFIYTGAEASFGGWFYTYALRTGLGDEQGAAYLTSMFWGSVALGRLASIPIAARFRPSTVLAASLAGGIASVAVMYFSTGMVAICWIAACAAGLSLAAVFPSMLSLARARGVVASRVISLFFAAASLGGMAFPWIVGQYFESVGPNVVMAIIGLNLIAGFAVFAAADFVGRRSLA